MIRLVIIALLLSGNALASSTYEKVTIYAAKQAKCSKQNPCLVKVHKLKNSYSVSVAKSASITNYGMLTFTTSMLWVKFDNDGNFISATPTP